MTILSKDFTYEVITVVGGTGANDGYTSTSTDNVTLNSSGPYGQLNDPDWSLLNADGSLNMNRDTQPKGIYLATSAEVSFIAAQMFYQAIPEGVTIMNFKWSQYFKNATNGAVIYVGGSRYYYAKWYGSAGLGLYCFVGYDASNPPTQSISVSSTGGVYDVVDGATPDTSNDDDTYGTDEDTIEYFDFTPGDGYDQPGVAPGTGGYPYFVIPTTSTSGTVTVTTTVPASTASPGVQTSITTQQIKKVFNRGWNSWARSINPLEPGKYLLFTTKGGIDSGCLSIGVKGKEGQGIAAFSHSLIVDSEGLKVYENGTVVHTMKTGQSRLSQIRIYRHDDNTIHYVVTTGTTTVVHRSLLDCPVQKIVPLYVYGHLYSSGDSVTAASFNAGEVQYGSV